MKKILDFFHFSDLRCSKSIEGLTRPGSPRKPIPFPILSMSNRKNEKNLGFFSFFRFDVLKIDRGAHPALATVQHMRGSRRIRPGSPGKPIPFLILSTSNRKNEKSLGFFSFFRFEVLDRGAHPALADPSQILSDLGQKIQIFLRVSESIWARNRCNSLSSSHFEPFSTISAKIPKFTGGLRWIREANATFVPHT